MNPRSNKTLIERFLVWWRGLFAQPTRKRRSMSSRQETSNRDDQSGVLGDLPDSERADTNSGESRRGSTGQAAAGTAVSAKPDRATTDSSANADIERQDDATSASGASDDEFREGGYRPDHVDQDDLERAAEADTGDTPSDAPGATGSFRSMTGGNVPADDSGWTVGGSTSAAEDSGSVASRGSGLDDPATIESDTPTMTGSGANTDVDRTGSAGVSDFDDASGTDDARATEPFETAQADSASGIGAFRDVSGDLDDAGKVHEAVGDRSVVDKPMDGDTDYPTAGYPSEGTDVDITDTDDVGVEDAESAGDPDADAADFSEDAGELGLADSESVDDGVADAGSTTGDDESGFTPSSSGDVGVGTQAEVDKDSLIADSDDATSAEARDEDSGVGADTAPAAAAATVGAAGAGSSRTGTGPEGSVRGDGTSNTPDGYPIKGNASSKIYHMPGMPSYNGTKPEWCFATEEDAIAAGYRAPGGRNRGQKREATSQGAGDALIATGSGSSSSTSGSDQASAPQGDAATGQDSDASEGVQSFASTADRDALADMQDTLAEEPDLGVEADTQGLGGLGSDPSAADDPTSVGTSPAGFGEPAATDTDVSSMQPDTIEPATTPDDTGTPEVAPEPVSTGIGASGDGQGFAGAVKGDGTKICPVDYPIKGNAGSMIYHAPGRSSYDATIPEWCFATEDDAVNAGFRAPKR